MQSGHSQIRPNLKTGNQLKPLPEETDYFDPKFIEFHDNNSKLVPQNKTGIPTGVLSHFISGDTPTLYAGTRQKNNTKPISKPNSESAFTFFGMPIPSLNLNNFWNSGKSFDKQKKDGRRDPSPPTEPEVHKNGFVPLLPGVGGFVPINVSDPPVNHTVHSHHVSGHATVSKVSLPTHTRREPADDLFFNESEQPYRSHRNVSHRESLFEVSTTGVNLLPTVKSNISQIVSSHTENQPSTTETPTILTNKSHALKDYEHSSFSNHLPLTSTHEPGNSSNISNKFSYSNSEINS